MNLQQKTPRKTIGFWPFVIVTVFGFWFVRKVLNQPAQVNFGDFVSAGFLFAFYRVWRLAQDKKKSDGGTLGEAVADVMQKEIAKQIEKRVPQTAGSYPKAPSPKSHPKPQPRPAPVGRLTNPLRAEDLMSSLKARSLAAESLVGKRKKMIRHKTVRSKRAPCRND